MRRCLCALMLSCVLALGSLTAGDLTTAQAQQIVSAAQGAQPGKPVEVTLAIHGKNVAFTVTRDALGGVTAQPVPGPDSAGITIALVTIQFSVDSKGLLTPTSLVVVSTAKTTTSYAFQLNPDGTVASIYQPGVGGAGGVAGASKPKPVIGGIGGSGGSLKGESDDLPADRYPGFTSGQLQLPAGTKSGEASASIP